VRLNLGSVIECRTSVALIITGRAVSPGEVVYLVLDDFGAIGQAYREDDPCEDAYAIPLGRNLGRPYLKIFRSQTYRVPGRQPRRPEAAIKRLGHVLIPTPSVLNCSVVCLISR
jgi:hypothetical protein